jgi:hypothetical protein
MTEDESGLAPMYHQDHGIHRATHMAQRSSCPVAQISKSAVSQVSKPAPQRNSNTLSFSGLCRLRSRRYSRFGNLRYNSLTQRSKPLLDANELKLGINERTCNSRQEGKEIRVKNCSRLRVYPVRLLFWIDQ